MTLHPADDDARVCRCDVPDGSLLRQYLAAGFDHEDLVELALPIGCGANASADQVMAALLAGFIDNPPRGVSRLMAVRNRLVAPFGLRTSRLGCPASSLLATQAPGYFAARFPVLAQRRDADGRRVEVMLGADDRHLLFRTCVGVSVSAEGRWLCTLGTRVQTRNLFGRVYLAAIQHVHRYYIAPAMLRLAVAHAVGEIEPLAASAATCRAPNSFLSGLTPLSR